MSNQQANSQEVGAKSTPTLGALSEKSVFDGHSVMGASQPRFHKASDPWVAQRLFQLDIEIRKPIRSQVPEKNLSWLLVRATDRNKILSIG